MLVLLLSYVTTCRPLSHLQTKQHPTHHFVGILAMSKSKNKTTFTVKYNGKVQKIEISYHIFIKLAHVLRQEDGHKLEASQNEAPD